MNDPPPHSPFPHVLPAPAPSLPQSQPCPSLPLPSVRPSARPEPVSATIPARSIRLTQAQSPSSRGGGRLCARCLCVPVQRLRAVNFKRARCLLCWCCVVY
ncbi:hypothetical protein O3P69_013805 [Scylla paramamosain]|uniref:Uncharacterized protein n=1 Tax=Scylla paramamosain TaxID=85552 RepID=A0AAW0SRU3_SCYPA